MITVISPSIRNGGLDMVAKCLKRQTFKDFEWIVSTNYEVPDAVNVGVIGKTEGTFYSLNRDWNKAYQEARGDLIINIVDWLWFPSDTLERLWNHYKTNPKGLVTTIGHQYKDIINNKPENLVWSDPRARVDQGSFYEVAPSEMEMCICSIPKQAIIDCGGLDEVYDTCPAVSEKEMCWRLDKLGYKFFIDQSIEYRALKHDRLSKDWDELYHKVTTPLFTKHMQDLQNGTRSLNVGFVKP